MAERDRSDLDLRAALRAFAEDAPTDARPVELARRFAMEHPHRRIPMVHWRPVNLARLAWILLLLGLLLALGAGALLVGSRPESGIPAVLPAGPSPTANPDEVLVAELAALMSTPYDPAAVTALYAPDAVVHDLVENLTQTGLEEIGARIRYLNTQDFEVVVTSAPIRQGDFVSHFARFGGGEAASPGLVVYEIKDGKVVNQWMYSTP